MGFNSSTNPVIHGAAHEKSTQPSKDRGLRGRRMVKIGDPRLFVAESRLLRTRRERDGSIQLSNRGKLQLQSAKFDGAEGGSTFLNAFDMPLIFTVSGTFSGGALYIKREKKYWDSIRRLGNF